MTRFVTLIMLCLFLSVCLSCRQKEAEISSFEDKVRLIENNPRLYLSKTDTVQWRAVNDEKEATRFLLSALTGNYIDEDRYPSKELLLESIRIFETHCRTQPQLEALFLLAGIYRKEKDLHKEAQTIERAIRLAGEEGDSEWLFHLYSYLGEMYLRQYNMLKFIKYQTLANQCIKKADFQDMSIATQVQAAKSFLYIEQYQEAYKLLQRVEHTVNKNNSYYNEVQRLQGIALYRMKRWSNAIEKMEAVLEQERVAVHRFSCHSILTYCYYQTNDLGHAKQHQDAAMKCDTGSEICVGEIEFYRLCAEFAAANRDMAGQVACLDSLQKRYASVLAGLDGQSLDEAIQAYTRVYEREVYEKKVGRYRYGLMGLLAALCLGLLLYIGRRRKQVYRVMALQQQIQTLEKLEEVKDETKAFILRDFEIARRISMLRYTQKEQAAKLLKDLDKFSLIQGNDLLSMQWERFYHHIDLTFGNFCSLLRKDYPCLNEKEVQLCCLLVAGFKTEEIAAVWMQSVFSVHKYKTSIRKKLQAPDGANIISFLYEKWGVQE